MIIIHQDRMMKLFDEEIAYEHRMCDKIVF